MRFCRLEKWMGSNAVRPHHPPRSHWPHHPPRSHWQGWPPSRRTWESWREEKGQRRVKHNRVFCRNNNLKLEIIRLSIIYFLCCQQKALFYQWFYEKVTDKVFSRKVKTLFIFYAEPSKNKLDLLRTKYLFTFTYCFPSNLALQ